VIQRRCVLGALFLAPVLAFAGSTAQRIWVVSNGWHSGIVLARADVPESVIPEIADFPQAGETRNSTRRERPVPGLPCARPFLGRR
jgi:hypothetical protein